MAIVISKNNDTEVSKQKTSNPHYDLCKQTAEWAIKKNHLCVYEYQSYASYEFPDVLAWDSNGKSRLYEIKVSRGDFLGDMKKECRQHLRSSIKNFRQNKRHFIPPETMGMSNKKVVKLEPSYSVTYKQKPHLGLERFYVVPDGLVSPDEVHLFGLYWYNQKTGKFRLKKKSELFIRNLHAENRILVHAVRATEHGWGKGIISKP
jgi:hypothetical protein